MKKTKSITPAIGTKEELLCANKVKITINTDRKICETTGSAIVLSVSAPGRTIDIHLTDVEFVKLQSNLAVLKLKKGEQVAHL